MKSLRLTILLFLSTALSLCAASWEEDYDRLLRKYVLPDGVLYEVWKADTEDMEALEGIVKAIGSAPAQDTIDDEAKAFFMNAYNAWVLHEVLTKFPLESVKDVPEFFEGARVRMAGRRMSFNELEKDVLMKRFQDPRVHFSINCASTSCPPLAGERFRAEGLGVQLDKRAIVFINSEAGVRRTAEGYAVSKVFEWYAKDFEKAGGVIPFINRYRSEPIPADAKLTFLEYDWSLNAKEPINQ